MTSSYSDVPKLLQVAVNGLGGRDRPQQRRMAIAVAKACQAERHLAVQAGTGTGKSLAYLIPAIVHARQADTAVVVSTATIALQQQLVQRDLPKLAQTLDEHLGTPLTYAIMKGRSNYLCKSRLAQAELLGGEAETRGTQDPIFSTAQENRRAQQAQRLFAWAEETETGDRDDLKPGVSDELWRSMSVSASECVGARVCPFGEECFAELARHQARDVDIVVTNHALLAIDSLPGVSVLPEHDTVIVDEAHELADRITSAYTTEIGIRALNLTANRAKKLQASTEAEALIEAAELWHEAIAQKDSGRIQRLPESLKTPFVGLRDALWRVHGAIAESPEGEATNDPEQYAERSSLTAHVEEQHDAVVRILEVFEEPDPAQHTDVVWIERPFIPGSGTVSGSTVLGAGSAPSTGGVQTENDENTNLKVAPLSIASTLANNLFSEHTVVLTSATLALNRRFDIMAAQWGMPSGTWDSLDVGTPFEVDTHSFMYIYPGPKPSFGGPSTAVLEEMQQMIEAVGGRSLCLFTSYNAMNVAYEYLEPRLPYTLYKQGQDRVGNLVEAFAAEESSCLFGTLGLWQGVDVPGNSCMLVIIDRLPYPRPNDPLLAARKEAADAAGRSGFMEVFATHAAVLLAQGVGRLLRSIHDYGVVAVMDSRLKANQPASRFLRNSYPAMRATDQLYKTLVSLGNLARKADAATDEEDGSS